MMAPTALDTVYCIQNIAGFRDSYSSVLQTLNVNICYSDTVWFHVYCFCPLEVCAL